MDLVRRIVLVGACVVIVGCEGTGPVPAGDVPRVVRKLEKGSASARERAEKRLYETHPDLHWHHVLPLVERKSAGSEVRAAAIRIIGHTCGELGIPATVTKAAADPDPIVRKEAIRAITAWGDPDLKLPLRDLAAAQADPAVKADLEGLVETLEKGKAGWFRKRMFTAPDPVERALAARWLAEIGSEADVPDLIRALEGTQDGLMRQECILALGRIGGEQAKAHVRSLLSSGNGYTRGAAAIAQLSLRDPQAVPDLGRLIAQDTVGDIRVTAATALGKIGGPEAKQALEQNCGQGHPDKRVDEACATARRELAGT